MSNSILPNAVQAQFAFVSRLEYLAGNLASTRVTSTRQKPEELRHAVV